MTLEKKKCPVVTVWENKVRELFSLSCESRDLAFFYILAITQERIQAVVVVASLNR